MRYISAALNDLNEKVSSILEEERDSYDNIPENLTDGDRARKIEDAAANLEFTSECIEQAINYIDDATA